MSREVIRNALTFSKAVSELNLSGLMERGMLPNLERVLKMKLRQGAVI